MSLDVRDGGPLSTVQDRGRHGWRHLGVGQAGALDVDAMRCANRLVGNDDDAAVLECTLRGPVLALARPARIALCGAPVDAVFEHADGRRVAVTNGRPVELPAGTLRLGAIRDGLRAWLAIDGGIAVPRVLDSRATDLRGGFGGHEGRALRAGDMLPLGPTRLTHDVAEVTAPAWWIETLDRDTRSGHPDHTSAESPTADRDPRAKTATTTATTIRLVAHPDARRHVDDLQARCWRVDPRSDRQGVRLGGDALEPLGAAGAGERLSAPVAPGLIQLPPDGQPIVLLADAQTVGGYPVLGHVAAADLHRFAQLRPGDRVRWQAIDIGAARDAWTRRTGEIARLLWSIALRVE